MKLYFSRLNDKNEGVSLTGELFTNTDNTFTFHFDFPAKGLILADGKAHDLNHLTGKITAWWMDREGMYLRVFHQLGEHWFPDQLSFRYRQRG